MTSDTGEGTTMTTGTSAITLAFMVKSGTNVSGLILKPMVTKGTTQQTFEKYTGGQASPNPTYPQPIEVVTGTQEVKVENVNLANINEAEIGKAWNLTNNSARAILQIKVKPSTTYTLSFDSLNSIDGLYCYEKANASDTTAVVGVAQVTATKVITTNANTNYIGIQFNKTSIALTDIEAIKLQLEKGSTATTYQEHQEQTQTISLGDIELCKIGTYQDYLYKSGDKWYKKEQICKIANKTNWLVNSIGTNNRAIVVLASNGYGKAVDGFNTTNAVCNMLIAESQGTIASDTEINRIAVNNENIYIKFADTINTKALAEAQLDSMTNLVIYYKLLTANDIEITNTTLIEQLNNLEKAQSYNGTTNISSNGNLPIVLGVSALKGV